MCLNKITWEGRGSLFDIPPVSQLLKDYPLELGWIREEDRI